jgi:hypothetical protein
MRRQRHCQTPDDVLDEGDVLLDELGFRGASGPKLARAGPGPACFFGAAAGGRGGGAVL